MMVNTSAERIESQGGVLAAIGSALLILVMYAGLFHLLFAMLYVWLRKESVLYNLLLATVLSIVAYFLVRVPDIMSGDFISKMDLYTISLIIPTVIAFLVGGRLANLAVDKR
ncbi:hypothetical protein AB9P05_22235 [Roseivirga sp. BDSF3-8]|uniref:hypothetical protein n=1 Tax=Roseivirga sp. BDSF3-8 TaxID=3241598 RepID=UPI003531ECC8